MRLGAVIPACKGIYRGLKLAAMGKHDEYPTPLQTAYDTRIDTRHVEYEEHRRTARLMRTPRERPSRIDATATLRSSRAQRRAGGAAAVREYHTWRASSR